MGAPRQQINSGTVLGGINRLSSRLWTRFHIFVRIISSLTSHCLLFLFIVLFLIGRLSSVFLIHLPPTIPRINHQSLARTTMGTSWIRQSRSRKIRTRTWARYRWIEKTIRRSKHRYLAHHLKNSNAHAALLLTSSHCSATIMLSVCYLFVFYLCRLCQDAPSYEPWSQSTQVK